MELHAELPSLAELAAMVADIGLKTSPKEVITSCPECQKNSRLGSLKNYYVNLEESLVSCDNEMCFYMPGDVNIGTPAISDDLMDNLLCSFLSDGGDSLPVPDNPDLILPDLGPSVPMKKAIEHSPSAPAGHATHSSVERSKKTPDMLLTNDVSPSPVHSSPSILMTSAQLALDIPSVRASGGDARHRYLILWSNIDALCWLDVLLCMICHNGSVRTVSESLPYSSVIKKLLLAYDESQALIEPLQHADNNILHSVVERDEQLVKRGGGYCMDSSIGLSAISNSTALSSQDLNSATRKIHLARIKLECAREEIWQKIEPLLRCQRGRDDSPVFAFPLIVEPDPGISELFLTEYRWTLDCTACHNKHVTRARKHMITFPRVSRFSKTMSHTKDCLSCKAPGQQRVLSIDRYAPNLVMHFTEGLQQANLDDLGFTTDKGTRYAVSAVIEYKTSPNHFALWQREPSQASPGKWMCYDDLKSPYAQFSYTDINIPPHNVHIVFWESRPICAKVTPYTTSDVQRRNVCPLSISRDLTPTSPRSALYSSSSPCPGVTQASTNELTNDVHRLKPTNTQPSVLTQEFSAPSATSALGSRTIARSAGESAPPNVTKPGVRKPVSLLSAKISSKRPPLSSALSYGSTASVGSHGSYNDIIGAISQINAEPTVNPSHHSPVQPASSRPPPPANKSYLALVKPLLQKSRQQKGTLLTGYVPKSKREIAKSPTRASGKRKKVMFTGVSDNAKPVQQKPAVQQKSVKPANANPTLSTSRFASKKNLCRVSGIQEESLPVSEPVHSEDMNTDPQGVEDMPSLDDMLKEIGF